MKQPIKPKTMTHVAVAFPLHHYIITNKKYRKYKAVHFCLSWFTHAVEQTDKPMALVKAVHSTDYYKQ